MESYYSLDFFGFSYFGSSKGSIFHFSCLKSHVSGPVEWFTVPKKTTHRLKPTRGSGSGMTPESYENSSIFEPVSKATKAMKIGPKATQNHEKSTLESWEIQFLRKLIFAIPSMPNPCFCNPRHPNLDPKIMRKSNLEIDMKKYSFLLQKYPKSSQNGSPKSTKNR